MVKPIELIFTMEPKIFLRSVRPPILRAAPSPPPAIVGTKLAPTPPGTPPVELAMVTTTDVCAVWNPLPPLVTEKYVWPVAVLLRMPPELFVTRLAYPSDVPLENIR